MTHLRVTPHDARARRYIQKRHRERTLRRRDMRISPLITAFAPELRRWRHHLHRYPELGFEETKTAQFIADKLQAMPGVKVSTHVGVTGVVASITGKRQSNARTVGLRADMDALPMQETRTGRPYESCHPGVMHGCGHDGHSTMLLGAARHLAVDLDRDFAGTVHCIFQPAEEGRGGALKMIADGLFDRFACDEVYALHNWPGMRVGHVDAQAGPRMASSDNFDIRIVTRGGHAALPHLTQDPIVIGSHVVTALQSVVSRVIDPVDPVVLSVTRMHAGTEAYNVIPSSAHLAGTLRCFSADVRKAVPVHVERIVRNLAKAWDAEASVEWNAQGKHPLRSEVGYPPTVNAAHQAMLAYKAAVAVVGADKVADNAPASMTAEDFSVLLEHRPGAYIWLGAGEKTFPLHHPSYDFNDDLLPIGTALLSQIALFSLAQPVNVA